jgi:hypothetical protein
MTRRSLTVVAAAAAGAGIWVLVHRLTARVPPDDEQIRALFAEMVKAVGEKRVGDAVVGLSERFQGEGTDKRGVKQIILAHVMRGDWVSVTISDPQVEVHGDSADAAFDVVMARNVKGQGLAALLPSEATANRITCRLEREEGVWRVVTATRKELTLSEILDGADGAEMGQPP